ncbi:MAG: DUF6057 family protein [Bacteroidales bacterium]|nr:DUF6057 family protein [Bacteroidales bacterium]
MNRIKTNNNLLLSWLPYLVFFIASFIYFGFFVDYILFYQEKSSLFIFSSDFLFENLHQPGGFLIWLGKFLSTFFYYPLAGALIVSTILTLIVTTVSNIIRLLTGKNSIIAPFIIGAALFYLQTDYRFLIYNNLGLLLQLALFYLTIRYLTSLKGWIPVIIIPLWYFATGGFAWVFSILLTFYFVFDKEKKGWTKIVALWCLNLLIFYFSKEFLFFQTVKTLLTFPFTELNTGSQSAFFLSVAGILSLLPVIARIKFSIPGKFRISDFVEGIITTSLVIIILVIIGVQRYDKKISQYFHVEKLFHQNKFDEVIAFNTANPSTNSLTIFLNNIALCETDKLNDMLFSFPQSPDGKTLFLKWEMVGEILKRGGYFYYTIGMVNEAHRWVFENMVMKGHSPEGLKMLIRTELINGNYKVASKYITLLKNTFFYKNEAKAFEKLLFDDVAINTDPELGEKRQNRLETDFFSITDDPYINIERILATDSLNRKAFEYKLAFMLLKKDYQGIANELPKFKSLGFTKLPVHIEEAALALSVLNMGKLTDDGSIQISKDTELRWNQYLTVFQQYGTDPKAAEPALRRQFGNTFWYWAFYK